MIYKKWVIIQSILYKIILLGFLGFGLQLFGMGKSLRAKAATGKYVSPAVSPFLEKYPYIGEECQQILAAIATAKYTGKDVESTIQNEIKEYELGELDALACIADSLGAIELLVVVLQNIIKHLQAPDCYKSNELPSLKLPRAAELTRAVAAAPQAEELCNISRFPNQEITLGEPLGFPVVALSAHDAGLSTFRQESDGRMIKYPGYTKGEGCTIIQAIHSADKNYVLIWDWRRVCVLDVKTGSYSAPFGWWYPGILSTGFSKDEKEIWVATTKAIKILNRETNFVQEISFADRIESRIVAVDYVEPEILITTVNGAIIIDKVTGQCLGAFNYPDKTRRDCWAASFNNNKTKVLIINESTVKIFDRKTEECRHIIIRDEPHMVFAVFLGDEHLLTYSSRGAIKTWDIETGKCLRSVIHSEWAGSRQLSKNKNFLLTAGHGKIELFDIEKGANRCIWKNKDAESAAFTDDEKQIQVFCGDHSIFYDIEAPLDPQVADTAPLDHSILPHTSPCSTVIE